VTDSAVQALGVEGEWQGAGLRPRDQLAGRPPVDDENLSNRSPYPTLHLLRESSIERAMETMSDTDSIYRRNIETLQRLGPVGWQALWRDGTD
jgi:hypothetical protein